jgi:hypothetical protein
MTKELRVRVAEAKQRDAGRGKARIDDEVMRSLNIVAGDVVSIKGKRETAAVAWPAYQEDQDRNIIRIDGLLRKNAGASINEYVMITKADIKDASAVTLAPVDMRLNVDKDFKNFVQSRLLEFPLVEADSILVVILGSAIPFTVVRSRPHGIVKITQSTNLQVLGEPELPAEESEKRAGQLSLYRFVWLKDVERKYASDYTKFIVPEVIESDREEPVLNEAKKQAKETNQPVKIFVDLWTHWGKIGSFPWSLVKADGSIEYTYEKKIDWRKTRHRFSENLDAMDLLLNAVLEHEKRLDFITHSFERKYKDLISRLETLIKQLESQKPSRNS